MDNKTVTKKLESSIKERQSARDRLESESVLWHVRPRKAKILLLFFTWHDLPIWGGDFDNS